MKRIKQLSIWIIALFAITVTNPAWAAPTPGSYSTITSTQTTITVNWTRGTDNITPQNKLRYQVFWKKKSAKKWKSTGLKTNITTYTLTELEPNTEYDLYVKVYDEAGNQSGYGDRTVKTHPAVDTQYPTKGSYGTITSTTTTIAVNWTRGSDNVTPQNKLRYRLEWRKKSAGGGWSSSGSSTTDMTGYLITGLEPNTEYDLDVIVVDEADNGSWYGQRTIKTKAAPDTQDPTPGSYGTITSTANSLTVRWTHGTDNVTPQSGLKYRILWRKKSTTGWIAYVAPTLGMLSYTITNLTPDTEYEFFAVIFDAAGNSSAYPVKTARTLKPVADTQRPTAGTYSSITSTANSITLNWTRGSDNVTPTNKLKYHVRYETKANYDDGGQLYGTTRKTDITTETITGLKPDTEYYVEVRVEDEAGKFTDYGSRFIRTKPATIAVTGVTLSPASLSLEVGQTGGLTATVAPATATNKKVTWTSSNTAVATVDGSGTVKGIAPGTATITVKTDDGGKTATAAVTVKTATAPTVKVSDVTLNRNTFTVNGDYEEVQLTATVAPSNATDKSLTWSSDNPQVASVDANGLVTIHKKGKARVTARANDGSGRYDACDFNVIMTVGNETVDGLRVYAAGGALYLTLPNAATVHIYNVHGAMVKTLFLSAGDHVQPLPSGVYLVRVGERVTKILVK